MAGWCGSNDIASGTGGLGSIPGPVKSDTVSSTARHCYDISSKFEAVSFRRSAAKMGPATRYMLGRNTASMTKI